MSGDVVDVSRMVLAMIGGGVCVACLRFAWELLRYKPTQMEMTAERQRRARASLFRKIAARTLTNGGENGR